jgi:lipoprotein-releasing system ATP-binding protein
VEPKSVMLKTSEIRHSYKGTQSFTFPEIKCEESSSLMILGKSGVGKTTLLHILGGMFKPLSGDVSINGTSIYTLRGNNLDTFRGQNIGIVFQKPHFVQSLTAEENLMLAQKMAGNSVSTNTVHELLQQLNLDHKAKALSYKMSQGEQQRLSIARAIINKPGLILADEPTSALDDENCKKVVELLEYQSEQLKAALVIVTHDKRLKQYFKNHIELS